MLTEHPLNLLEDEISLEVRFIMQTQEKMQHNLSNGVTLLLMSKSSKEINKADS